MHVYNKHVNLQLILLLLEQSSFNFPIDILVYSNCIFVQDRICTIKYNENFEFFYLTNIFCT